MTTQTKPQHRLTTALRAPQHGSPLWAQVGARTTSIPGTLHAVLAASTSPRRPQLACSTNVITVVY